MPKRFTDTEIWKEDWFIVLPPNYKLFWRYICDICDCAGIWRPNIIIANNLYRFDIDLKKALELFNNGKERVVVLENDRWFLKGFISFQYGNALSESCSVHKGVLKSLKFNNTIAPVQTVDQIQSINTIRKRLSKKKKSEIINRDKFTCQYCLQQTQFPVVDHIIPLEKGGGNQDLNLATACIECNARKSDMDLRVFYKKYHNSYKDLRGVDNILNGVFKKLIGVNKELLTLKDKDKDKDSSLLSSPSLNKDIEKCKSVTDEKKQIAPHQEFVTRFKESYEFMTNQPFKFKASQFVIAKKLIDQYGYDVVVDKAKILGVMCRDQSVWFTQDGWASFSVEKLSSMWNQILPKHIVDPDMKKRNEFLNELQKVRERRERVNDILNKR